jgi:hypothetical protein
MAFQRTFEFSNRYTSQAKAIIVLTYGRVSEGRALTLNDAVEIAMTLGGALLYSQLSQR